MRIGVEISLYPLRNEFIPPIRDFIDRLSRESVLTSACPVPGLKDKSMTADELVALAREAALKAYAPYSKFHVGCAIESVDGEIVTGANMENACYRLGLCAEQSALTTAQHRFGLDKVARIAVSGGGLEGGGLAGDITCTPCGGCSQAIPMPAISFRSWKEPRPSARACHSTRRRCRHPQSPLLDSGSSMARHPALRQAWSRRPALHPRS